MSLINSDIFNLKKKLVVFGPAYLGWTFLSKVTTSTNHQYTPVDANSNFKHAASAYAYGSKGDGKIEAEGC